MADNDLCTLAQVKAFLNQNGTTSTWDTALGDLITSTSADFLRKTNRPDLLAADYTEPRVGDGGTRLSLRHWPLNSVASLTVAGTALAESADGFQSGYWIDTTLDPEFNRVLFLVGGASFTDTASVAVAYNAGYAEPPEDIAQAVAEWVAGRWRSRDGIDAKSQRFAGGEHTEYDNSEILPDNTLRVIAKYTRTRPSLDKRTDDRNYRVTRISQTITTTVRSVGDKTA